MVLAGSQVLVGWEFNRDGDLEGWQPNGTHLTDARVAGGALVGRAVDWDPFFISPLFDIPARHSQWIEARLRASHGGHAEVFWSGTLQTEYGGFSPAKTTPFHVVGDGQWHVYRIRPGWEPERKIIHLRLDFPSASSKTGDTCEVDYVRIIQPPEAAAVREPAWEFERDAERWTLDRADAPPLAVRDGALAVPASGGPATLLAPPVDFPAERHFLASIRLAATKGTTATLHVATDSVAGLHAHRFPITADGQPHTYLLDLSGDEGWHGRIRLLSLEPTDAADAAVAVDFVRLANAPRAPAELCVRHFGLADALPRAGQALSVAAAVSNAGGAPLRGVEATLSLPPGLTPRGALVQQTGDLWYGETRLLEWPVLAEQPLRGTATLVLTAKDLPSLTVKATVDIGPSLGLPKSDYVPEPKPAKTSYQVGAYYFPGWPAWSSWRPIGDYPERKPILGWYDEAKPEVVDWQIKWAVEHGLAFFAVDWYWCQGARQLEHWLHDGYFKARYRHLLKFCLLWANHNPPGTSSEADLLKLTDFWLEHYFKRPEYLTVEGKPVVILFSPWQLTHDLGSAPLAAAFAKMRERCRQAGLPGLYLIACAGSDRPSTERHKAEGYDALSGYNYPHLGAGGQLHAPFATLVPAYKELWHAAADPRLLKEIPALSGGWDSRPWHGAKALVRFGRTPELFERHCRDAKDFLDRRDGEMPPKLNLCLIEAWNEWGEGSYIEPHAEYGFAYLEAVRRVFAPDSPPPPQMTPRDLGLGPYDCPRPERPDKAAWDFTKAADRAEWHAAAQLSLEPSADSLKAMATGNDPILGGPAVRLPAEAHRWLCIEMRTTQPDTAQLFWTTTTAATCENNSVRIPLPGDLRFHPHWVDLGACPYWAGLVTGLRFDPVGRAGTGFELRSLRFAGTRGD